MIDRREIIDAATALGLNPHVVEKDYVLGDIGGGIVYSVGRPMGFLSSVKSILRLYGDHFMLFEFDEQFRHGSRSFHGVACATE